MCLQSPEGKECTREAHGRGRWEGEGGKKKKAGLARGTCVMMETLPAAKELLA